MAHDLLVAPEPPRPDWHHNGQDLDGYIEVHEQRLDHAKRYLVTDGNLRWEQIWDGRGRIRQVELKADLRCVAGVQVKIWKQIEPIRGGLVRAESYLYEAWQSLNGQAHDLFRYDCASHFGFDPEASRRDRLHLHKFDLENGHESVERVAIEHLPNFHQIIEYAVDLGRRKAELLEVLLAE